VNYRIVTEYCFSILLDFEIFQGFQFMIRQPFIPRLIIAVHLRRIKRL